MCNFEMKIGIYNIFTFFWFATMLLCGGTLAYLSFSKNLFTSETILIVKIVMGFMSLAFVGTFIYSLYKFRILIINQFKIISIHPFLFKIDKIDISKTKSIKWKNFTAFKGTIYRNVELKQFNAKIEISDLEFENFESLVKKINVQLENKRKIEIEQAISNNSMMIFNVILLSGFLVFQIFSITREKIHIVQIIFFLINIILLYASTKRVLNYRKVIKTTHNSS